MQVFFIIYTLKQNYKQFELETADIMTAILITLLPFPTELLHSTKARFVPHHLYPVPAALHGCEATMSILNSPSDLRSGLTSDQIDAKLFLLESSNIDIS